MPRTAWIAITLALGVLGAPLSLAAQQPANVPRVGYLSPGSPGTSPSPFRDGFLQALRDAGYFEGRNIAIDYRYAGGRAELFPDLAAELVRLKVDVIFAVGAAAAQAAKNATRTIPIVFPGVGDPVASGLVTSLARPGGNLTGTTAMATELSAKRLELLKEAVTGARRMAVLANPANPVTAPMLRETESAARSLGVRLQILEVRGPDEFESAFSAMSAERTGAFNVLPDPMFYINRRRLTDLAARSRLPGIYEVREFVEAGGLMSYGVDFVDSSRRAGALVVKILKGAKVTDLPVEQPMRFEFIINLKTAKALGLTIPQTVLFRADKVIQ